VITIHIPWSSKTSKLTLWNEICADIVEHFGLPGDKYTTEVTEDYMDFNFHNDHDGLMCKILVSDYI
jgi:hypothetical protein